MGFGYLPPTIGIAEAARRLGGAVGTGVQTAADALSGLGGGISDVSGALVSGPQAGRRTASIKDIALEPAVVDTIANINRGAIHASNHNAAIPNPGPAKELDLASDAGPRSGGVYVSPSDLSANVATARRGAFDAGPTWNGVGGGPRSAMQMAIDMRAKEGLDNEYKQGIAQNELEAGVRGDPMALATAARKRTLEYEDSLPADAAAKVEGGGRDYTGVVSSPLGTPTMGEYRANRSLIAQAQAKQDPEKVAAGAATMSRVELAQQLKLLIANLDADVRAGKRTQADADTVWARAVSQAEPAAQILKTGYPSQPDLGGPVAAK